MGYSIRIKQIFILFAFLIISFASSSAYGEYLLVVGSFKNKSNAQGLSSELKKFDYSPFIKTVSLPEKGKWHRVYLGPFDDKASAQEVENSLSPKKYGQMFIIHSQIDKNLSKSDNQSEKEKNTKKIQTGKKSSPPSSKEESQVTLKWTGSQLPNLKGYKIYYDTDSGPPYQPPPEDVLQEGPPPIEVKGNKNKVVLHGLSADKNYYFAITAFDEFGKESPFSKEITRYSGDKANTDNDKDSGKKGSSEPLPRQQSDQQTTIAAGDTLNISVPGQKQMSHEYDVSPNGKIYLMMIGSIKVSQYTPESLSDHLTKTLKKFIVKGQRVTVKLVKQLRYIQIQGGVKYPGWYRVPHQTKLEDLMFIAGGVLSGVDISNIKLKRPQDQKKNEYKTYSVQGKITLQPNDIIEVPMPEDYHERIDSGDLLFIRIPQRQAPARQLDSTDTADLTRDLSRTRIEVDRNGYIYLPNYGHINTKGKTPEKVKQIILDRLPRYLAQLKKVRVSITEKRHFIQALGHVKNPGSYVIPESSNVQEAVDKAGGALDGANMSRVMITRQSHDGSYEIKVNLYQYTITGDPRLLPPLHARDTLFVPISSSFGNIKRTLMPWSPPSEKLEEDTKAKVRIFGAIHNPGIYELKDDMNIMDLIVEASGETDDADLSKILLIRNKEVEKVYNFEKFLNTEESKKIPKLQAGDTVYIKYVEKKVFEPKEDKVFYVAGKIRSPGKYKLLDQMTIFQAIALAGGMTEWADKDNILIIRRVNGKQRNIPLDYNKAIEGKYPEHNIFVRPDDTIYIP